MRAARVRFAPYGVVNRTFVAPRGLRRTFQSRSFGRPVGPVDNPTRGILYPRPMRDGLPAPTILAVHCVLRANRAEKGKAFVWSN